MVLKKQSHQKIRAGSSFLAQNWKKLRTAPREPLFSLALLFATGATSFSIAPYSNLLAADDAVQPMTESYFKGLRQIATKPSLPMVNRFDAARSMHLALKNGFAPEATEASKNDQELFSNIILKSLASSVHEARLKVVRYLASGEAEEDGFVAGPETIKAFAESLQDLKKWPEKSEVLQLIFKLATFDFAPVKNSADLQSTLVKLHEDDKTSADDKTKIENIFYGLVSRDWAETPLATLLPSTAAQDMAMQGGENRIRSILATAYSPEQFRGYLRYFGAKGNLQELRIYTEVAKTGKSTQERKVAFEAAVTPVKKIDGDGSEIFTGKDFEDIGHNREAFMRAMMASSDPYAATNAAVVARPYIDFTSVEANHFVGIIKDLPYNDGASNFIVEHIVKDSLIHGTSALWIDALASQDSKTNYKLKKLISVLAEYADRNASNFDKLAINLMERGEFDSAKVVLLRIQKPSPELLRDLDKVAFKNDSDFGKFLNGELFSGWGHTPDYTDVMKERLWSKVAGTAIEAAKYLQERGYSLNDKELYKIGTHIWSEKQGYAHLSDYIGRPDKAEAIAAYGVLVEAGIVKNAETMIKIVRDQNLSVANGKTFALANVIANDVPPETKGFGMLMLQMAANSEMRDVALKGLKRVTEPSPDFHAAMIEAAVLGSPLKSFIVGELLPKWNFEAEYMPPVLETVPGDIEMIKSENHFDISVDPDLRAFLVDHAIDAAHTTATLNVMQAAGLKFNEQESDQIVHAIAMNLKNAKTEKEAHDLIATMNTVGEDRLHANTASLLTDAIRANSFVKKAAKTLKSDVSPALKQGIKDGGRLRTAKAMAIPTAKACGKWLGQIFDRANQWTDDNLTYSVKIQTPPSAFRRGSELPDLRQNPNASGSAKSNSGPREAAD